MVEAGLDAGLLLIPAPSARRGVWGVPVPTDTAGVERIRVDVTTRRPVARVELRA
ncbi:MAG: hypothetical protein R2695_18915 [Acidimicrobiales bacterium]